MKKVALYIILGLGRATFFKVRVGFWACGFGSGRARATENFHGFISGCNISSLGHIRAAFGPHLGRHYIQIMLTRHKKSNYCTFLCWPPKCGPNAAQMQPVYEILQPEMNLWKFPVARAQPEPKP